MAALFDLSTLQQFTWPVTFDRPVNGKHEAQSFDADFKIIAANEAAESLRAREGESEDEVASRIEAFLYKAVIRLHLEVADTSTGALCSDEEVTRQVIDNPILRSALLTAYTAGIQGRKRKNS